MTAPDYAVLERVEPAGAAELGEILRAAGPERPVRLIGTGTAQARLPAPARPATVVAGTRLCAIRRLEADDLTCSVEPGLPRAELDAALAAKGLCLPCAGNGTLGGLFAAGEVTALAPGAFAPRSLLLGLEGLLGDGTAFKCGAKVVKSVAGFDLHKVFVGSRGTLFAATLLHLKLRPRPRASTWFANGGLAAPEALHLWHALRREAEPFAALALARGADGWVVHGRVEGSPAFVRQRLHRHALRESDTPQPLELVTPAGHESVRGLVLPSRLAELLAELPAAAPFLVHGTGLFATTLRPEAADRFLARLPALAATGEVAAAAPARRGRATPRDPTADALARRLKQALDPRGVFC
ncbi:MAG: FAD-binding oxidoreductase [Planctomycetes bacterium]|nr:FAD-binding oxidoreductase [Planctomycetota bacterium]